MEEIDTYDWSHDRKAAWAQKLLNQANDVAGLEIDAHENNLNDLPRTITTEYHGESRAEALGRAYKVRDEVEDEADVNVECELTGVVWRFEDIPDYYGVEIHVESR